MLSAVVLSTPLVGHAALRSSHELSLERLSHTSDDERGLLRVEWRAEQSRAEERSVLADMLARLERIDAAAREVHRLIAAMPAASAAGTAAPSATRTPAAGSTAPLHDDEPAAAQPLPLLPGAIATLLLALLAWAWQRRRQRTLAKSAATSPTRRTLSMEPRIAPIATPLPETPAEESPAAGSATSERNGTPLFSLDADELRLHDADHKQALELAEIMLSMGLAAGAAQTLQEHIRSHPRQALLHWLRLLDVYRASGNKFQYEAAVLEMQKHFNIQPENWAQLHAGEAATLESFTRILSHIESLWRRPAEALGYLQHLLEDNRGGTRAGFPQGVAKDILLLMEVLKQTTGGETAAA